MLHKIKLIHYHHKPKRFPPPIQFSIPTPAPRPPSLVSSPFYHAPQNSKVVAETPQTGSHRGNLYRDYEGSRWEVCLWRLMAKNSRLTIIKEIGQPGTSNTSQNFPFCTVDGYFFDPLGPSLQCYMLK